MATKLPRSRNPAIFIHLSLPNSRNQRGPLNIVFGEDIENRPTHRITGGFYLMHQNIKCYTKKRYIKEIKDFEVDLGLQIPKYDLHCL